MRIQCLTQNSGFHIVLAIAALAPVVFQQRAAGETEGAAQYYVATNGRDDWTGMLSEPNANGTDGPLATLKGARDAIRRARDGANGQPEKAVTVCVRGGTYRFAETLALGKEDGGSRTCPVTYKACPGEEVILSGGRLLEGWQPFKGKVLECELADSTWRFRQLFYNGKRQTRARYPKCDPANPLYSGWLRVQGPGEPESYVCFKYPDGSCPRAWAKPAQGEVFLMMAWGYTTLASIEKMDVDNHTITMAQGVRNFNRMPWNVATHFGYSLPCRFYIENVLEELDQPGEWCLDSEDGKVYFWPPDDAIEHAEVSAPVLDCLIDLRDASHITFSGFTFTETSNAGNNIHRDGVEGAGAMFPVEGMPYCGETVHLAGAEFCRVENNRFLEVGGNGVYLEGYNLKNTIQGNEMAFAGHCGVAVGGRKAWNEQGQPQHPVGTEIVDNHILHCGVFDKVAPGVFCAVSDGTLIGHNLIEEMPHHAINLGAAGYGRQVVEYNRIRHCCLETYDNAAVNCWMEDPDGRVEREAERSGHVFRHNWISDTRGCNMNEKGEFAPGGCTFGLYLDNFTSNCFVYGNLIVRSGQPSGIRVNGGKNNIIENNVIIDCQEGISIDNPSEWWPGWERMRPFMGGNRFCRNIVARTRAGDSWPIVIRNDLTHLDRSLVACDSNLYSCAGDGQCVFTIYSSRTQSQPRFSLSEWQERGYDPHSVATDPMFVDPAQDDFRLKPESQALELGFEPIGMERIGPRIGRK